MKEFFNQIGNFFVKTLPAFVMQNLVMCIVCGALILLVIVLLAVIGKSKRDVKYYKGAATCAKKSEAEMTKSIQEKSKALTDCNAKCTKLSIEVTELKEECDRLQTSNDEVAEANEKLNDKILKISDMLSDKELELGAKIAECQEKDTKIANMTIERDGHLEMLEENKKTILDLTLNNTKFEASNGSLNLLRENNEETIKDLRRQNAELVADNKEKTNMLNLKSEAVADWERRYLALAAEVERLKNFELENQILLNMIRKGSAAPVETVEVEDVAVEEKSDVVVLNEVVEGDKFDKMTRQELFKAAKAAGLSNFATWTSEKIREELRKN